MIGQTLGHFRVVDKLGEGGMGAVYRAKDSKLGRDVAIKVLPEEFAQDEERLRRFQREAKVLASLNHPNIAAIHGLEESEGTHYLVLELVEGETLAERIARGALPVEEAIAIAMKIAEALEEAHERGIVHRDLKPANVKLTPDDKVKVLDFGLAKAFAEEMPEADGSMSPTRLRQGFGEASPTGITAVGVILGTAAYMSPEQAKGKHVDKRTDIFAFGAVLYEMLTGEKAFPGDNVSEVLAAVIQLEPDWDALPQSTPDALVNVLRSCLAKDAKLRLRDIGDLRLAMGGAFETKPTISEASNRWTMVHGAAIALGCVMTGAVVWLGTGPASPTPSPTKRFSLELPSEAELATSPGAVFALANDG